MRGAGQWWLGVLAALSAGWVGACSHAPQPSAPEAEAHSTARDETGATARPPWRFHPLKKAPTMASLPWKEGAVLEVDESGSRWLRPPTGPAEVSAFGAPEALIGFVRDGERWGAVGRRGTVYFFRDALGPWEEVRTPEEPLMHAVVTSGAIYGLSRTGRAVVSDDAGRSYETVKHEGVLVDLAATKEHGVVFVAAPERWLSVADDKRSAEVLDLPTIAPLRIEQSPSGQLLATSLYGPRVLTESGWAEPSGAELEAASRTPGRRYPLPEHARVDRLESGKAVMSDGRYFSVEAIDEGKLVVRRGSIDAPLQTQKVPAPDACVRWRLLGAAEQPVLVCAEENGPHTVVLQLHDWDAEKGRFLELPVTLRGDLSTMRGTVWRGESIRQLALTGACPPHAQEKGCAPEGIVRWGFDTDEAPSHLPLPEKERWVDLQYSPRGTLHVLAAREGDGHLILESLGLADVAPRSRDLTRVHPALRAERDAKVRLGVGPEGAISVVAKHRVGTALATLDSRGRFLVTRAAPEGVDALRAQGRRAAGLDVRGGVFWTSTDYGASFSREVLPQPLCGEEGCSAELACDAWGCLVGPELVRVGYEASESARSMEPRVDVAREAERVDLPALECQADETAWQTLEGLTRIPAASDAWLGKSAWASATFDEASAAVDAVFARASSTQIERHPLLGPVPDPEHYALALSPQVEGSVALRARLTAGRRNAAGAVEVGWDNRVEDIVARATLDPALGDVPTVSTSSRSRVAKPALLSIGGRGLHVQLASDGSTVFVRPGSTAQTAQVEPVFETSWPPIDPDEDPRLNALLTGAREERIVVQGQPGALLLLSDNRIVVRAAQIPSGPLESTPILLGSLADDEAQVRSGVRLAYRGHQIGFVTFSSDADAVRLQAEYVGLSSDEGFEAPVRVPVLSDLPLRPEFCAPSVRSSTPRIIAPELGSTVREVVVGGLGGEAVDLRTDSAVLFGTPDSPCLAGYEAVSATADRVTLHGLVTSGPNSTSWLFAEERTLSGEVRVRAQPMTCAWSSEPD